MLFEVSFFDSGLVKFPAGGTAVANPDLKASAVAFIQSTSGGSGSCPQPALAGMVRTAAFLPVKRKVILYVTDGGGTCAGSDEAEYLKDTLKKIASANSGFAHIYSLQMGAAGPINSKYLRDLAAQNGGEYHVIPVR